MRGARGPAVLWKTPLHALKPDAMLVRLVTCANVSMRCARNPCLSQPTFGFSELPPSFIS
ncbi:hypothetical protein DPMN_150673 [Dreissena polymorpha]|uniref:Uncharacterized protein n=1 Tax=Dreissena polymorpha TaxID=45954 RepID=A0A9D4FGX5_DREPO|nr:hypothetical protein DPMN_150673 [Dreissena polymorpha]